MFEHQSEKLISRKCFVYRMLKGLLWALLVIATSLILGIFGYHFIENIPWIDSLLNASMILGGMGHGGSDENQCRQTVRVILRAL